MSNLPRHPDTGDAVGRPAPGDNASRPWPAYLLVAVVIGLIALIVVLHLTGAIDPSGH